MDCHPVLETLVGAVASLPGAVLRVDVHRDVLDAKGKRHDADLVDRLRAWEGRGEVRLRVHDFFTDEQLWTYLCDDIDVSVLPYRFGTHSGWLEACHDLGTVVLAPDCGFYRQQRPCLTYGNNETSGFDAASLIRALGIAYHDRPQWRTTAGGRRAERVMIARAHRRLYTQLVV
jgi:hypothetical protein